jgi:hypothetical protein
MATVPGTPMDDDAFGGIHPSLRPTQADLLLAAGIMHEQGHPAFAPPPQRLAMDTSKLGRMSTNIEDVRPSQPQMDEEEYLKMDLEHASPADFARAREAGERLKQQDLRQRGFEMQEGLGPKRYGKIRPDDPIVQFRRRNGE